VGAYDASIARQTHDALRLGQLGTGRALPLAISWSGAGLFAPNLLSLVFRRVDLLRYKIRQTVRPALEGRAILDRKRIVKDVGTDMA
jgi:hypothetical protein